MAASSRLLVLLAGLCGTTGGVKIVEQQGGRKIVRAETRTKEADESQHEAAIASFNNGTGRLDRKHRENPEREGDWPVGAPEVTFTVMLQQHRLSAPGKDCPVTSFPVKNRRECAGISRILVREDETFIIRGDPNMQDESHNASRPHGCYIQCKGPECESKFNDGGETLGDKNIRRYCKDYFSSSAGTCLHSKTGQRNVRATGTFPSATSCMLECMQGQHASWCEGFEASEPFNNECRFFDAGFIGNGDVGSKCYARMPSQH